MFKIDLFVDEVVMFQQEEDIEQDIVLRENDGFLCVKPQIDLENKDCCENIVDEKEFIYLIKDEHR